MAKQNSHKSDSKSVSKSAPDDTESKSVNPDAIVRVYHLNKSKGSFIHGEHRLDPGSYADVPQHVADLWLSTKQADGAPLCALQEAAPATPEQTELAAKAAKLEEENASMSKELEGLRKLLAEAKANNPAP